MSSKIKTLEDLQKISRQLKSAGKRVVHCHGVFDLLHLGHIKHFDEARSFGDILIVTVTPDNFVKKGPNRPVFTTSMRLEALAALEVVDYVAANNWPEAVKTIEALQPTVYCKGQDYKNHSEDVTGKINDEQKAVESVGGEICYTEDITFSSSSLLNEYGNVQNKSQKAFIKKMLGSQNIDQITKYLINKFY